jgi:signal peptidase II
MYYLIIITVIILDQVAKYVVKSNFELFQSVPVVSHVLNITYIQNNGAAFSVLQNKQAFLIAFTAIVSIGILIVLVRNRKTAHWTMSLSLSLIIAGGVGNMLDRLLSGYVVDFFELRFMVFPVFNIADIAVVSGSMLLILYILIIESAERKKRIDL